MQELEDRKRIQQLISKDPGSQPQQPASLHSYSTDALLLKVESLQAQLNEQRQLAGEHISALLEDRRIREYEEAAHRAYMDQQVEGKEIRLKGMEEQLRQTTKDYILARREKQAAEEKAAAADTALQEERQQAAQDLAAAKCKADKELREAKQHAETKVEDVAANLRKQLKAKVEEAINLTSVHGALKAQYEKRIAELEEKCTRAVQANKQLELRRYQDMEGFTADVTHLRKTLTAVDRKLHEMRLIERLDDDDRLDTILNHLRRTRPDSARGKSNAEDGGSEVHSVKGELFGSMQHVCGRVKGLEERLASKKKLFPR
ncbi:hypothetical protein DUNSADRAFT_14637 [Dunaliella salina]|uniref:Uncharacterized protein n=1 Tax=Dunaliella salina TaxID=3046 RepID=A0ABQ7G742_DUNSA|nr:hypothetical protein DUNSADRAFT_14637 [Dunaliella salina]|eukprot:KAF5830416.1 hypothetical protein DUNSADRAFT_14637 [Dunaliella salina]